MIGPSVSTSGIGERREHTSPALLLSPDQASAALSMSRDSFDRFVRDELRLVRVGRMVRVPVAELERWVDRHAARPLLEELSR